MRKLILLIICVLNALTAQGGTRHGLVKQGNKLYGEEKFGDAIAKYLEAYQKGQLPLLDYNLGNAHFKSGALDKAAESYFKSLNNASPELKAKAMHNIGNALLQSGKAEDAVKAYINSLKLNPGDMETKQNLEYALRQMQQQQNQKDKQDKQQQKDKQNQQDQQNKQDQQQKQEQQEQQQQNQQEKQEQEQQQQAQQKPQEQMSEQQALNILNALQNDEKQVQEKVIRQQMAGRKPKDKNW